jgi:MFS family permease
MAYILQGSIEEWSVSRLTAGIFGALFQLGLLLGSLTWGYFSDTYGRNKTFKASIILSFISGFILLFSFWPTMAGISLFLLGFILAGEVSIAGTYFFEYCPPSKRHYMTALSFFFTFGSALSACVAFIVSLVNTTSVYDWRYIVGFACVSEAVILVFRMFLHETPTYLYEKRKISEFERVLNRISMRNKGVTYKYEEKTTIIEGHSEGKAMISENESIHQLSDGIYEKSNSKVVLDASFHQHNASIHSLTNQNNSTKLTIKAIILKLFGKELFRPTITFGIVNFN